VAKFVAEGLLCAKSVPSITTHYANPRAALASKKGTCWEANRRLPDRFPADRAFLSRGRTRAARRRRAPRYRRDLPSIRTSPCTGSALMHGETIRFFLLAANASLRGCDWPGCRKGSVCHVSPYGSQPMPCRSLRSACRGLQPSHGHTDEGHPKEDPKTRGAHWVWRFASRIWIPTCANRLLKRDANVAIGPLAPPVPGNSSTNSGPSRQR
jgi:hypothetical protein